MTARDIIIKLQSRGATIEPKGEGFTVKAPCGSISEDLREALATHKAEIVSLLNRTDVGVPVTYIKRLTCPHCRKPLEIRSYPTHEETWLSCPEGVLFKSLKAEARQWCKDCEMRVALFGGRCPECLQRLLLSPGEPCPHCGGNSFWRHRASREKPAGFGWHCAACRRPATSNITFYEVNL